jgi:hypothetical protein
LTRTRWIQYGVLLAVAFVLSVGAGALIGRQRTGGPVAGLPTPTPAPATVTPSPAPATPTTVLTPSPSPVLPTIPPTAPPTSPPTVPPSAPPALDPPTAEDFAGDLLAAFQTGDREYLFDRLHPLVFERYGERRCRRFVNEDLPPDPTASWTVLSSNGPAPWDWVTDELTTTVSDTWTVLINIPDTGEREVHFAPSEGKWRWFADCGVPR